MEYLSDLKGQSRDWTIKEAQRLLEEGMFFVFVSQRWVTSEIISIMDVEKLFQEQDIGKAR